MFNNNDDEVDFCESYKSEILGTKNEREGSLVNSIIKLLTIVLLLAIIIGVSFYGYNYFMRTQNSYDIPLPPVSMQISDDDLVVEVEEEENEEMLIEAKENQSPSLPPKITTQQQEDEIEKIANDVKIAIAKSESEELNKTKAKIEEDSNHSEEASLEIPTLSPKAQYLEDLAKLSREIDKERKN